MGYMCLFFVQDGRDGSYLRQEVNYWIRDIYFMESMVSFLHSHVPSTNPDHVLTWGFFLHFINTHKSPVFFEARRHRE